MIRRGKKITFIGFCTIVFMSVSSFIPKEKKPCGKNNVVISFEHFVGDKVLNLDSSFYKNAFGQSYTITKFKYYIGNIHLEEKNGRSYSSPGYFLINEDEQSSKKILLEYVPDGEYTAISFTLGVDSLHNCSGAQSGSLDPAKGMFWAWNTGYVFLKVEGKSATSKSPGNILEFHIGGYKEPNNCIRTIRLALGDEGLTMANSKNAEIGIKVDISEIFKSPTDIDFSKLSSVVDFRNSVLLAENYIDMFSILPLAKDDTPEKYFSKGK